MPVDTKLYDTLGVQPDASASTIKKRYFDLAKKYHPDKGGDPEKFKEIDEAYRVLKDDQLRRVYDQTGSMGNGPAGMPGEQEAFNFMNSLFEQMPFGPFAAQSQGQRKTPDVVHEIGLSLEALYKGTKRAFAIKRTVLCKNCGGKGAPDAEQCRQCRGQGHVTMQHRQGPFVMNTQVPCPACKEVGFTPTGPPCSPCNGQGHLRESQRIELLVPAGAPNGHTIVMPGKSDEKLFYKTGDLVFIVREKPHESFRRHGADLRLSVQVPLVKALVGGTVRINHISGECLDIDLQKGQVIKPGEERVIEGEGMPVLNSSRKGNLIVTFQLIMPSNAWAAEANANQIKKLLAE